MAKVAEAQTAEEQIDRLIQESESLPAIDTIERLHRLEDARFKTRTLINTWKEEQEAERILRKRYANWLLVLLSVEVAVAVGSFVAIGFGWMNVEQWVANTFFVAIFTKIASMTWIVLRHLFPSSGDKVHKLIERL